MAKVIDKTAPQKITGLKVSGVATENLTNLIWNLGYDNVGVAQYEITVSGVKKVYKSKKNSLSIKKLSAGTHTFTVVAIDKAKNRSIVSNSCKFTVKDITAPKGGKIALSQKDQNNILVSFGNFNLCIFSISYFLYWAFAFIFCNA